MGLNSFELTGYYVNLEILYQGYYFLESVCKVWHTCKVRLMGVWRLSRVELMLWVRGVTQVDMLSLLLERKKQ
jgi:hypothetical protein